MKTETLHFRVGSDAGLLLMTIAQEHLLYTLNPEKAVKTITESLSGCPVSMALKIIKGDMVVLVDEEKQEFSVIDRDEKFHSIFPKLDIPEWYKRKHKEIGEEGRELYRAIERLMNEMAKNNGMIEINFPYKSIMKFADGNIDPIFQDFKYEDKINEIKDIIRITKNYLDTTQKLWIVMDWLQVSFPRIFDIYDWEGITSNFYGRRCYFFSKIC